MRFVLWCAINTAVAAALWFSSWTVRLSFVGLLLLSAVLELLFNPDFQYAPLLSSYLFFILLLPF